MILLPFHAAGLRHVYPPPPHYRGKPSDFSPSIDECWYGRVDLIFTSAGRGVHSRAQSARALPGVLMAKGVLSILKFFRSAH